MTIEIKHYDTFNLVKSILQAVHEAMGPVCYDEICDLLKSMDKVPTTDDNGYFVEENPFDKGMKKVMALVPEEYKNSTLAKGILGHEAMGPVCYDGWLLKKELMHNDKDCMWIDDCIEAYEKIV